MVLAFCTRDRALIHPLVSAPIRHLQPDVHANSASPLLAKTIPERAHKALSKRDVLLTNASQREEERGGAADSDIWNAGAGLSMYALLFLVLVDWRPVHT
jgi:hypothetical protein